METSRTPALIGNSYKDLPSSITKNLKLTAKYKNQAKTLSSHSMTEVFEEDQYNKPSQKPLSYQSRQLKSQHIY